VLRMRQSEHSRNWFSSDNEARMAVLSVLRHHYVRESQHAMRYRQHAERIHHPELRQELLSIATEEQKHAESLGAEIQNLGGELPEVIPVHVAKEQNLWLYLRTDLEEEERCGSELRDDLLLVLGKSPEIARLLNHIDEDCKRHWLRIRAMLAESDPLSPGPP
jgi:rubrerythrin